MKEDMKFVVGGAAVGAILGALVGWLYLRSMRSNEAQVAESVIAPAKTLDRGQIFRLATSVVSVIRQLIDLS